MSKQVPAPVGLKTLRAWRCTGLVLCTSALVCCTAFVALGLATGLSTTVAVTGIATLVFALIGLGFLQRAWSDPDVREQPSVVRARRLSEVAMTTWGVALIPNAVFAWRPELEETLNWLSIASFALGCVAVTVFIGMLVIAVRWRP
jgi:hypothetical protein